MVVPAGTLAEAHSPAEEGSPAVEDSHPAGAPAEGSPVQGTAAAAAQGILQTPNNRVSHDREASNISRGSRSPYPVEDSLPWCL